MRLYLDVRLKDLTKFDKDEGLFTINLHSDLYCESPIGLRVSGISVTGYRPPDGPVYLTLDGILHTFLNKVGTPILARLKPDPVEPDHTVQFAAQPLRSLSMGLRSRWGPIVLEDTFRFCCILDVNCL